MKHRKTINRFILPLEASKNRQKFLFNLEEETLQKFVLTGGACTGKTSLLGALSRDGFQTVPEVPTLVFAEHKEKGITTRGDSPDFQKLLLKRQLEFESKLDSKKPAFLDRSCIDMIAYSRFFGIEIPKELFISAEESRFNSIFILEFLPSFDNGSNAFRWGTLEDAKITHKLIHEAYLEFGYQPISIPAFSVHRRAKFVTHSVESSLKEATNCSPALGQRQEIFG